MIVPFFGYSQCVYNTVTPIQDNDTTSVSLIISGALENDLASPDQGVCAVNINLNHAFLGDLFVELVSPAGERLKLMGPAVNISPSTNFVTWGVQFNACSFPVFPDAGYEEDWDNLQPWFGGTLYSGTYYPYEGCLEDLNIGEVNGEWKLEIIDQSMFGEGMLNSFELYFCNTEGVSCDFCEPGEHALTDSDNVLCQFDDALDLELNTTFLGADPTLGLYDYGYIVFESDTLYEILSEPDLSSYDAGFYTVCGVSYLLVDSIDVFTTPTGIM